MGPDYWFVIAGAAALCVGVALLGGTLRRRMLKASAIGGLWLCLSAGLLLQGFAPHPHIRDRAFVMPVVTEASGRIDPIGLAQRTRRMHQLSLLATLVGALGLAFCYRRQLLEPRGG
jgi:hypothetical protein